MLSNKNVDSPRTPAKNTVNLLAWTQVDAAGRVRNGSVPKLCELPISEMIQSEWDHSLKCCGQTCPLCIVNSVAMCVEQPTQESISKRTAFCWSNSRNQSFVLTLNPDSRWKDWMSLTKILWVCTTLVKNKITVATFKTYILFVRMCVVHCKKKKFEQT